MSKQLENDMTADYFIKIDQGLECLLDKKLACDTMPTSNVYGVFIDNDVKYSAIRGNINEILMNWPNDLIKPDNFVEARVFGGNKIKNQTTYFEYDLSDSFDDTLRLYGECFDSGLLNLPDEYDDFDFETIQKKADEFGYILNSDGDNYRIVNKNRKVRCLHDEYIEKNMKK